MTTFPPGDWRNNPGEPAKLRRVAILNDASVRLDAPNGHAMVCARKNAHLASNAYWDGANWWRHDPTQSSTLFVVEPGAGQPLLLYTAAAGTGAITWNGPYTISAAPATDANGWQVAYQGDGKRRWRKRWLGLATSASVAIVAPGFPVALPVGVASLAQVDAFVKSRAAAGSWEYNAAVEGNDSSTTLKVTIATIDGQNLNVNNATFDLFVELVER